MKKTQPPALAPQREVLPMRVEAKIHALHASGPFVSIPGYKAKDGYKDICFSCTKEFRQQFYQAVLDAYQQTLAQFPQRQRERDGQSQEAPPAPKMKM